MSFATDTSVEPSGPGRYTAELPDRWSSLVGIHGGYSAAVVVRAIEQAVADPTRVLRTLAVQFAAPPRPGPADVAVTIERSGRSVTATSARLLQEGQVLLVAHAISSPARPGLAYDDIPVDHKSDPADAPIFTPPGRIAHFQNAEVRLDPEAVPFGGGDEARIAAWLRPLDGEAIDAAWLVAMGDILPPAVFARLEEPTKAATIEYVVHLATGDPFLPAGEYVYLSCQSPLSSEGFAIEDATLWGPDGRVLAVARQTRLAARA